MSKIDYDGVLEAGHFTTDGHLEWVRVYLRRGPAFGDRILLSRQAFVDQLKSGKRFMLGERILNMGGNFNVTQPVHLLQHDGNRIIVVGDGPATKDELAGMPII
jgi:hypothetical protein